MTNDRRLLEGVADIILGQSPPGESYNSRGDGHPFLQGKAEFDAWSPRHVKYTSDPIKVAPREAILISVRAPVGATNIADREYAIGRGLAAIVPHSETIDRDYLLYWLKHKEGALASLGTGSTFQSINKATLKSFSVDVPSLIEQRAIAKALRAVQRAKEQTEQVVEAVNELRKSFLTYEWRGDSAWREHATPDTPPARWKRVTLGEVLASGGGSIQTGPFGSLLHAESYVDRGPSFVMPKDMMPDGRINRTAAARVTKADYERLHRYRLAPGDVVLGRRGEIGRYAVVTRDDCPALCGSGSLRIRTGEELLPEFLGGLFLRQTTRDWLSRSAVGSTMLNLNTKILKQLPLLLPPIEEQRRVSEIVVAIQRKSRAEKQKQNALDQLFKALLHELMTGRVRLEHRGKAA